MSQTSGLLSPQEAQNVFEIISPKKQQSLAMAVARLYASNAQAKHKEWIPIVTGVVCFIKDFQRRSYYITAYDMDLKRQVWEQELYNEMSYKNRHTWFHTFEAEREMAGICFVEDKEAEHFYSAVVFRLDKMQYRERRRSIRIEAMTQENPVTFAPRTLEPIKESTSVTKNNSNVGNKKKDYSGTIGKKLGHKMMNAFRGEDREDSQKEKKVNKSAIGNPMAFVHVSGVKAGSSGLHMVENFDEIDPRVREFLKVAGLNTNLLENPKSRQEIETFVNRKDVQMEMNKRASRMIKPSVRMGAPPPAPPNQQQRSNIPPPPSVSAPPPPSMGGGAPPPPPPPPPPPSGVPIAPPLAKTVQEPVVPVAAKKPTSAAPPASSGRMDMLSEIREKGGIKSLHKAEDRKLPEPAVKKDEEQSLTKVLEDAFTNIKTAWINDSDEDESSDSWSEDD